MYVCKCDMLFNAQYWCTYCIYVSCNPNLHYSVRTKFCMVSASAGTRRRSASAPSEKARLETAKVCVCFIYPMHSRDDVSGSVCMYVLGGSANSPASGKGDQNAATLTGNDINTNTHTSSKFINRSNSNNSVGQPSLSLSSRSSSSRYSYIHPDTVRTDSVYFCYCMQLPGHCLFGFNSRG